MHGRPHETVTSCTHLPECSRHKPRGSLSADSEVITTQMTGMGAFNTNAVSASRGIVTHQSGSRSTSMDMRTSPPPRKTPTIIVVAKELSGAIAEKQHTSIVQSDAAVAERWNSGSRYGRTSVQ